jgi:hypothetical protein
MKWLCGLSFVQLTFFGALNKKRILGFLFGVFATLWTAAPAAAWGNLNDSEEPGSVLVFPKFVRGFVQTPDRFTWPKTLFEISVTCPNGATCPQFENITLRAHWVCPQDSITNTCRENDFNLFPTVKGTLRFSTEGDFNSGNVFPPPPSPDCDRGYLVVWVIDANGNPIKFDGLIGDAVIRTSATSARAYNAIPIQAASSLATLDQTAADTGGVLAFDGNHYQQVTGTIFGSVAYENGGPRFPVQTDLTLLTLDVISGRPNPVTSAALRFYNEYEGLTSAHTQFTCWEEVRLTDIDRSLTIGGQFSLKGLVESDAAVQGSTPVTMLGLIDTEEDFANPISITGDVTVTIPAANVAGACVVVPGIPPSIRCRDITTTVTRTLTDSINLKREYTYPLFNDSMPVTTTFVP